jgi:hypothetical protein
MPAHPLLTASPAASPAASTAACQERPAGPPLDWAAISQLMAGCGTAARALPAGDPALGFTASEPVLLIEPFEPLMATDPATGGMCDLQVELLVRRGFTRFQPGAPVPGRAAGWRLRVRPVAMELVDGSGNVWASNIRASPDGPPPAAWLSSVEGRVLVLYGAWLGVRAPRGVREAHYGPAQRAAELRDARMRGLVAAASLPVTLG